MTSDVLSCWHGSHLKVDNVTPKLAKVVGEVSDALSGGVFWEYLSSKGLT